MLKFLLFSQPGDYRLSRPKCNLFSFSEVGVLIQGKQFLFHHG